MRLTVIGCGDAFGSGGRLQTCYHVHRGASQFLIDCGASTMIGLNRAGLDPNAIETILISHLHGDHFGGLVWWMLHAQHVARRATPLDIVGPVGIEARFRAAAEALFPRSTETKLRFAMRFHELRTEQVTSINGIDVTPYEVLHPSGAPSYALRMLVDGRTIAFSGDSEWTENIAVAGRGADLYMIECYTYDGTVPFHMSYARISAELPRIGARKVMLTHMSTPMLARRETVNLANVILAEDGMTLDL